MGTSKIGNTNRTQHHGKIIFKIKTRHDSFSLGFMT